MSPLPFPDPPFAQGELRQRPGDQQLPEPGRGPLMHDQVIAELRSVYGDMPGTEGACADLLARQQLGISRYGRPLQAHNGRNALRDAYEELLDFLVYARQAREEELPGSIKLVETYFAAMRAVVGLREVMDR